MDTAMHVSKQTITLLAASVSSLAVGGAAGYLVAKRQLETKYNVLLEEEVARVQEHNDRKYKTGKYSTVADAADALLDESEVSNRDLERIVTGLRYNDAIPKRDFASEVVEAAKNGEVHLNIFEEVRNGTIDESEFTEQDEDARSPEAPYILRAEEFMNGEVGYPQISLTFYEADMVLADEEDQPINEYNTVVGVDNLNHFGKWSGDRNTVYIRNDRSGYDYEVVRHGASFKEVVLGYADATSSKNRFRDSSG